MNNQEFEFVSRFLRGQDLEEGKLTTFIVRKENGKCWGWRESQSQYGAEVIMPNGQKKKVEFFIYLRDLKGQDKIFTRNGRGFWQKLKELNLKEGERITLTRIGIGREARYFIDREKEEISIVEETSE